jgi:hypothetical protein
MALVASALIAMNAGRFKPAGRNYSMNHSTQGSELTV